MERKIPKILSSLHLRRLDKEVKMQFYAWCVRRNKTMTQVIETFMRNTIKKDK